MYVLLCLLDRNKEHNLLKGRQPSIKLMIRSMSEGRSLVSPHYVFYSNLQMREASSEELHEDIQINMQGDVYLFEQVLQFLVNLVCKHYVERSLLDL